MTTDQTAPLDGFILFASIYESSLECILICAVLYCGPIGCSDISATNISAWTFGPRTFRPRKMPKVDVSAIAINFGFGMYACINV